MIFARIDANGDAIPVKEVSMDAIRACPHLILTPDHYDSNGNCRCRDERHTEMLAYGYRWSLREGRWI